jgi:signal transduction histidine kinase
MNIQGTGLGLNIVRKYTELMGGSISFKSSADNGTTFSVILPQSIDAQ